MDRPALDDDEVEITPEMIEAGLRELYLSSGEESVEASIERVSEIYRAMALAAGKK